MHGHGATCSPDAGRRGRQGPGRRTIKWEAGCSTWIDVEALFAIKPQPCLSEAGDGYLLFRIGDCVAQRNTHAAIYDALRLCKDF
ncbi:MAG TPA: hypothetical protein ENI30_02025 [Gammaproteobacteria bacterium]|nr:hypothetical protein [Gammaproteobacteria bacterium]